MAIKKEVHRRAVNREGPWKKAKKTLNKATDFVKRQLCDLLQIFHNSNAGTKVVVSSVIAGIILIMFVSAVHTVTSKYNMEKEIEEIDRQILQQQEKNEEIENEFRGDMDEIMERLARERLGMIYPDEEEFINRAG